MTVEELIRRLKALPQDHFVNFDVKDKYLQEVQMELTEDSINIYPNNVWITFELDEDNFLEI